MRRWVGPRRPCGPIGLDIGHDSVRMVQLRCDPQGLAVQALQARRRTRDPDEKSERQSLVSTIRGMLEEGDFHGTEAALCVAQERLRITSVRVPQSDTTPTEALVRREAALRFGLDPAQDSIRIIPAGRVHEGDQIKQEVIVFAADHGAAEDRLALVDEAGLTAVGLGSVPCALVRVLEQSLHRDEDRTGTVAWLDVGRGSSTLVFVRSGQMGLAKVIANGAGRFNEAVAARFGIEAQEAEALRRALHAAEAEGADAAPVWGGARRPLDPALRPALTDALRAAAGDLVREVCLCARYYAVAFRGRRVTRLIVSGGGAYEPVLCALLASRLGVEVDRARPWQGLTRAPDTGADRSEGCEWAVALGLALQGWPAGRSRAACPGPAPAAVSMHGPPAEGR